MPAARPYNASAIPAPPSSSSQTLFSPRLVSRHATTLTDNSSDEDFTNSPDPSSVYNIAMSGHSHESTSADKNDTSEPVQRSPSTSTPRRVHEPFETNRIILEEEYSDSEDENDSYASDESPDFNSDDEDADYELSSDDESDVESTMSDEGEPAGDPTNPAGAAVQPDAATTAPIQPPPPAATLEDDVDPALIGLALAVADANADWARFIESNKTWLASSEMSSSSSSSSDYLSE